MLRSGSGSGLCHEKPSYRRYRSLPPDGTKPSDGQTDLVCDQRLEEFRKEKEKRLNLFLPLSDRCPEGQRAYSYACGESICNANSRVCF